MNRKLDLSLWFCDLPLRINHLFITFFRFWPSFSLFRIFALEKKLNIVTLKRINFMTSVSLLSPSVLSAFYESAFFSKNVEKKMRGREELRSVPDSISDDSDSDYDEQIQVL